MQPGLGSTGRKTMRESQASLIELLADPSQSQEKSSCKVLARQRCQAALEPNPRGFPWMRDDGKCCHGRPANQQALRI